MDADFEWELSSVTLDGELDYQEREKMLLWLREANKW